MTLRIRYSGYGNTINLMGALSGDAKVVRDVRRGNVSVGFTADDTPRSVYIRNAQKVPELKELFARLHNHKRWSKRQSDAVARICFENMAEIEAAYRLKHSRVEITESYSRKGEPALHHA